MVLRTGNFLTNGDQTNIIGRKSKYEANRGMLYSEIRCLKVWYKFTKVLKQPVVSISRVYPKNNILQKRNRENSKLYTMSATNLFCCVGQLFYKNILFKFQMWSEILKKYDLLLSQSQLKRQKYKKLMTRLREPG
jgi:membrane protein YdbS with pleckstrin-like domain